MSSRPRSSSRVVSEGPLEYDRDRGRGRSSVLRTKDSLADIRTALADPSTSASASALAALLHDRGTDSALSSSRTRSYSHSHSRSPRPPLSRSDPSAAAASRLSGPSSDKPRHRSNKSALLSLVLTEAERKTEHLRAMLRVADDRADTASRRVEAAEGRAQFAEEAARRAEDALRRADDARTRAESAVSEVRKAKEECARAQARAEAAERENRRLERENERLERERRRAEVRAEEAIDALRRREGEVRVEKAWEEDLGRRRWEEGRQVGLEEGYEQGREIGYDEGLEAGLEEVHREEEEREEDGPVEVYEEDVDVPMAYLPRESQDRIRAWAQSTDESMRSFSPPKPKPSRLIWLQRRIQKEPRLSSSYH